MENYSWEIAKSLITEDRIKWAFESMAPYKSPGEQVRMEFYLFSCNMGCSMLSHLFANYTERHSLLLSWRIARVSFIPKPGRLDYTNSEAFRPISLTSFLLTGLEKLVIGTCEARRYWIFHYTHDNTPIRRVSLLRVLFVNLLRELKEHLKLNNTPSVYSLTLRGHLIILPPQRSGKLWRKEKLFDLS